MKSLVDFILGEAKESIPRNVKEIEEIKGNHYFIGSFGKADGTIKIYSDKWTKIAFDDEKGEKNITAWYCPSSDWVIYKYWNNPDFHAVFIPDIKLKIFTRFNDVCKKSSNIENFTKVDTNIQKVDPDKYHSALFNRTYN